MKTRLFASVTILVVVCSSFVLLRNDKPVLFIIGDSTVRNGDGSGKNLQWGWGSFISGYFDTTKIAVSNQAIGGRSSRTFITEGRWDRIISVLKPGDHVIMQFGHNDAGPLDDTSRARGTIPGTGDEAKDIYNPITKKQETVYSYGWYMRKYIRETKEKGAVAIVCSPVPRDNWKEGKVNRSTESYAKWAKEIAMQEKCLFLDLNDIIATEYEKLGAEKVKTFFPADHTHTNLEGAQLNASIVIAQLKKAGTLKLLEYLR